MNFFSALLNKRDRVLIVALALVFIIESVFDTGRGINFFLWFVAFLGALPTLLEALRATRKLRVTIETFNALALVISFVIVDIRSAAFIGIMLAFARMLETYTQRRASRAITELLSLKPTTASVFRDGAEKEVPSDTLVVGDVVMLRSGGRVPVDGRVFYGSAFLNEASVSGESRLVSKVVGDEVLSGTIVESGNLKINVLRVGADSTVERMAKLISDAEKHKSKAQRLADRFASIFLPVVAVLGLGTYLVTGNILMVASIFLVACADDMAVAIPLALTASLGRAARRGVIIKGGEYLDVLALMKIVVLDKTGTLTYGTLRIDDVYMEPSVNEEHLWQLIARAEKFSEHPIGKAVYREAAAKCKDVPDPDEFRVYKGSGIVARCGTDEIAIGDESLYEDLGIALSPRVKLRLEKEGNERKETVFSLILNKVFVGFITVTDVPRVEAVETIAALKRLGVKRVIMFTGDNAAIASYTAKRLGIDEFRASMLPEDKVVELEALLPYGPVGMIGDGINDAPALARADVGIAMGGTGTAVAVETANVVILADDLSRVPEMIELGRRTRGVVHGDMGIWFVTNIVGFAFAWAGMAPVVAAFYNLVTDFFPLFNSARLFRAKTK